MTEIHIFLNVYCIHIVCNAKRRIAGIRHKQQSGSSAFETACGAASDLELAKIEEIPVERAVAKYDVDKCGRCFNDGGGY